MDCLICGKVFSDKRALKYHMDHKVCQKTQIVCHLCNKEFTTLKGLHYHIENKVCVQRKQKQTPKLKPKLVLRNKYNQMSHNELVDQLIHLQGKYESLKENPQNINNINNINNNIIIFPKEFGKEDMSYIQQKLGDIVGPLVKSHMFDSIPRLFCKIHNNQVIPEYHNVFSTSERSNYAMISDGHLFKHQPKKTVIDQIIESKRSILRNYIDSNGDQLGEKVLQKYEKYQDRIDEDMEFRKHLELEIGGMLLDMKSVIANDEKTRQLLDKVNDGEFDLLPSDESYRPNQNNMIFV